MTELYSNNASTTLATGISSSTTTVVVATGTGAQFPSPTGGNYFTLTLNDALTGQLYEITYCTARTGDTMTVTRGQEGTTARAWLLGDFAYNALTAVSIANLTPAFTPVQQGGGASQTNDKVYIGYDGTNPGYLRYQVDATDFGDLAPTSWVSTYFAQTSYVVDNFVSDTTFAEYINQPVLTTSGPTFQSFTSSTTIRAGTGALGSSDPNRVTILNDFNFISNIAGQYIQFPNSQIPNGIILQFGNLTTTNGVNITFPEPFPTACLAVVVSESNAEGPTWGAGAPTLHGVGEISRTGFVHWTLTWNGTGWAAAEAEFCFYAFGY